MEITAFSFALNSAVIKLISLQPLNADKENSRYKIRR